MQNPSLVPIEVLMGGEVATSSSDSGAALNRMVAKCQLKYVRVGIGMGNRGNTEMQPTETECNLRLSHPNHLTTNKDQEAEASSYQNPVGAPGTTGFATVVERLGFSALANALAWQSSQPAMGIRSLCSVRYRSVNTPGLGGQRATN